MAEIKSGVAVINTAGKVVDMSQLTKWELNKLLRGVAETDGPDMLIHHIWPLVTALAKANKEIEDAAT